MRDGFSLIQTAVVLIIIGLLAGGILVGKELVRSAELASVVADFNKFEAAVNQFQTTYGSLPGDMKNATSYWPTANNGNGNGLIDYNSGMLGEEYNAWQHLNLAGLIPGVFNGTSTITLPPSKVNQGYYRISYQTGVYGRNGHLISLNRLNLVTNLANKAILAPVDVYAMDLKYDDGLAATGEIMGFNESGNPGTCVTNDYTAGSGTYMQTNTAIACKIFFYVSGNN